MSGREDPRLSMERLWLNRKQGSLVSHESPPGFRRVPSGWMRWELLTARRCCRGQAARELCLIQGPARPRTPRVGHNQHKFSALRLCVACWKLLRHGCDPTQGQTSLPPSSVHVTVPIEVATAQPSSAPGWFTLSTWVCCDFQMTAEKCPSHCSRSSIPPPPPGKARSLWCGGRLFYYPEMTRQSRRSVLRAPTMELSADSKNKGMEEGNVLLASNLQVY